MIITKHNPDTLYPKYKNYSHAIDVTNSSRLLLISGLNGYFKDGETMPDSFKQQGEMVWEHLGAILKSAQMNYSNLVSIRTYLSSPEYDNENVELRKKYLGDHEPASTVICCQLLDAKWKIELEATAMD